MGEKLRYGGKVEIWGKFEDTSKIKECIQLCVYLGGEERNRFPPKKNTLWKGRNRFPKKKKKKNWGGGGVERNDSPHR